jgi:very-short-patch-repair endonuclease
MSLPETMLWQRIRAAQAGVKFRRQHPIGPYVVDFYSRDLRLVLEIDGEAHDRADRPKRDADRDRFMAENGYRVVRISAHAVVNDVDEVAASIALLVARPLHHACGMVPLPASGEDAR